MFEASSMGLTRTTEGGDSTQADPFERLKQFARQLRAELHPDTPLNPQDSSASSSTQQISKTYQPSGTTSYKQQSSRPVPRTQQASRRRTRSVDTGVSQSVPLRSLGELLQTPNGRLRGQRTTSSRRSRSVEPTPTNHGESLMRQRNLKGKRSNITNTQPRYSHEHTSVESKPSGGKSREVKKLFESIFQDMSNEHQKLSGDLSQPEQILFPQSSYDTHLVEHGIKATQKEIRDQLQRMSACDSDAVAISKQITILSRLTKQVLQRMSCLQNQHDVHLQGKMSFDAHSVQYNRHVSSLQDEHEVDHTYVHSTSGPKFYNKTLMSTDSLGFTNDTIQSEPAKRTDTNMQAQTEPNNRTDTDIQAQSEFPIHTLRESLKRLSDTSGIEKRIDSTDKKNIRDMGEHESSINTSTATDSNMKSKDLLDKSNIDANIANSAADILLRMEIADDTTDTQQRMKTTDDTANTRQLMETTDDTADRRQRMETTDDIKTAEVHIPISTTSTTPKLGNNTNMITNSQNASDAGISMTWTITQELRAAGVLRQTPDVNVPPSNDHSNLSESELPKSDLRSSLSSLAEGWKQGLHSTHQSTDTTQVHNSSLGPSGSHQRHTDQPSYSRKSHTDESSYSRKSHTDQSSHSRRSHADQSSYTNKSYTDKLSYFETKTDQSHANSCSYSVDSGSMETAILDTEKEPLAMYQMQRIDRSDDTSMLSMDGYDNSRNAHSFTLALPSSKGILCSSKSPPLGYEVFPTIPDQTLNMQAVNRRESYTNDVDIPKKSRNQELQTSTSAMYARDQKLQASTLAMYGHQYSYKPDTFFAHHLSIFRRIHQKKTGVHVTDPVVPSQSHSTETKCEREETDRDNDGSNDDSISFSKETMDKVKKDSNVEKQTLSLIGQQEYRYKDVSDSSDQQQRQQRSSQMSQQLPQTIKSSRAPVGMSIVAHPTTSAHSTQPDNLDTQENRTKRSYGHHTHHNMQTPRDVQDRQHIPNNVETPRDVQDRQHTPNNVETPRDVQDQLRTIYSKSAARLSHQNTVSTQQNSRPSFMHYASNQTKPTNMNVSKYAAISKISDTKDPTTEKSFPYSMSNIQKNPSLIDYKKNVSSSVVHNNVSLTTNIQNTNITKHPQQTTFSADNNRHSFTRKNASDHTNPRHNSYLNETDSNKELVSTKQNSFFLPSTPAIHITQRLQSGSSKSYLHPSRAEAFNMTNKLIRLTNTNKSIVLNSDKHSLQQSQRKLSTIRHRQPDISTVCSNVPFHGKNMSNNSFYNKRTQNYNSPSQMQRSNSSQRRPYQNPQRSYEKPQQRLNTSQQRPILSQQRPNLSQQRRGLRRSRSVERGLHVSDMKTMSNRRRTRSVDTMTKSLQTTSAFDYEKLRGWLTERDIQAIHALSKSAASGMKRTFR